MIPMRGLNISGDQKRNWRPLQSKLLGITGVTLILCAGLMVGFAFFNKSSYMKELRESENVDSVDQLKTYRSARARAQVSGGSIPCHLSYIERAKKGQTSAEVIEIMNRIRLVFPDRSKLLNHEALREYRDLQIEVIVIAMTTGLQLSSYQQERVRANLSQKADHQYQNFVSKYTIDDPKTGFVHEGKKYIVVSASDQYLLYKPKLWLAKTQPEDLVKLTEHQLKILPIEPVELKRTNKPSASMRIITNKSAIVKDIGTGEIHIFNDEQQIGFPILGHLFPLTTDQETKFKNLLSRDQSESSSLMSQCLILTREQLTISLLIYPDMIDEIERQLSQN